jgi:hypothetical protein
MFHSYIPPVNSQDKSLDSTSDMKSVVDHTINFEHGTHGKIATVTATGLHTERDRFPEKTSKEFAEMIYESISSFVHGAQFERGKSPIKFMIEGKPIVEVGSNYIELQVSGEMSHFDQWVFMHLQRFWKERKN